MNATETLQHVESIPECVINDAPRLLADFPVGSSAHQGDVIFVAIKSLPKSAKPRLNHQLADGNTQGSRHILTPRAKVYDCDKAQVIAAIKRANKCVVTEDLIGPVFVSPAAPTEHDVTHPEHGDIGFEERAVIACVFQRNLDSLERARRVQD